MGAPAPRDAAFFKARARATFPRWLGRSATTWTSRAAPEKRQVPHHVPDLVPEEFVGEPQLLVHDSRLVQDHRVLQRSSQGESSRMEGLGVGSESEGPGRSDLLPKRPFAEEEGPELPADSRVLELDGGRDPEAVSRVAT